MKLTKIIKNVIHKCLNENADNTPSDIVYHASNNLFNKFYVSKITNINGDLYGSGFYFSDNYDYVKQFGSIIYECAIKLKNPIDLTDTNKAKQQLLYLLDNITEYDDDYIRESIDTKNFTSAFRKIRKYLSFTDLKGYFDGVIGYSEMGGKEYVVYDPNDIEIVGIKKLE